MKKYIVIASVILTTGFSASAVTTGFGTIPGSPGANPYSGSGIPINTSEYAVASVGDDTVTIAMAATAHGSGNPAPTDNGAGTYNVGTGLVGGRSVWNFDFYGNSALGRLSTYVFSLTETANGHTFTFIPTLIPDNVGGPNSFGNSESLDFATFGVPILYDPNANDTYHFELTVTSAAGGPVIATDDITVIAGRGAAVPDASSTMMLMGVAFTGLSAFGYRRNRQVSAK